MNEHIFAGLSVMTPFLLLALGAMASLISWLYFKDKPNHRITSYISAAFLITAFSFILSWTSALGKVDSSNFYFSVPTAFMSGFLILITLFLIAGSLDSLKKRNIKSGEYNFLLLSATLGALLLISSADIFTIFISLELLSMSIYALAGITKNEHSLEASLKYFMMGALASAFMVMAIAFIYGSTGTLNLAEIKNILQSGDYEKLLSIGLLFLLAGLMFKIALIPFHFWTPDVYEGAPSEISAFMASLVKTAGIVAIFNVFYNCPDPIAFKVLLWLCIATILISNLMALPQQSVKRMLAYSSVAHAGYMMLGFFSSEAWPVFFYAIIYSVATLGAFLTVFLIEKTETPTEIKDFNGLYETRPLAALSMAVFLFSLAGIPPLAGFFGKFHLFVFALKSGHFTAVIFAVLGSAISLYYYLQVIVAMFMKKTAQTQEEPKKLSLNNYIIITVLAGFTLLLGIFSNPIIDMLKK